MKVQISSLALTGAGAKFTTFPIFGAWWSDRTLLFGGMNVILPRAPTYWVFLGASLLRLSLENIYEYGVCGIKIQIKCIVQFEFLK